MPVLRWSLLLVLAGFTPAHVWAEETVGSGNGLVDQSVNSADFESAVAGEAAKVDAAELAKPLTDEFGLKSEAKLKDTMNYDDCFDWSYKVILYPACSGSCPGKGCFPLADITFTYTEPTVMVQTVREPGAGSLESVPGQKSQLKQVLTMGTGSGRSAPGVSPLRTNMPTAGYIPQLYFEAHVWGISPAARFESSAGQMEVKQSLSCDIADEVSYWPAAIIPQLFLAALPPIVISKAILGSWGWKWFRNAGSSQLSAIIGNQTISDIGSTVGFVSDAAGTISDVGGTASGESGGGAGIGAAVSSAAGGSGGGSGLGAAVGGISGGGFDLSSVTGGVNLDGLSSQGIGGVSIGDVTGAVGDAAGQIGTGIKDGATAVVGADVVDGAGNVIGQIGDTAGTVVNDAGEAIGQFNGATQQVMNGAGEAIGQVGSAVGDAAGQVGDAIAPVTGAIGDAAGQVGDAIAPVTDAFGEVAGQVGDAVGQVTGAVGDAVGQVTGAVGDAVGQVTGAVGDAFGEVGTALQESMGDLFSGDSMLGSLGNLSEGLAALDTLSSIADMADSFMGSLSALTNLFSDVKLAPNYISEMQETSWRHGPPGVLSSLKSMIGSTPFLCTPGAVLSEFGVDGISNALSSICVGSWGPLEPRMGWVPTSGDPFPASGLAGYRAYKNIEYSIWSYKRNKGGQQVFNLDYPHRTGCEKIGTPDLRWESRMANAGSSPMLDLGSSVFGFSGGAASGVSDAASGASDAAAGVEGAKSATSAVQGYKNVMGSLSDSRVEASEYVYTYWKDSECTMTVCTADWEVLRNRWSK
jgi:hypothetical protein